MLYASTPREVRLSTVASPWLRLFLANYWPNGCVHKHKHLTCICASHMYACMIMHVSVIYIYIHDIHVCIYHYHALWCMMYNDVCSIMFPENSHRFISYQWIAHGVPLDISNWRAANTPSSQAAGAYHMSAEGVLRWWSTPKIPPCPPPKLPSGYVKIAIENGHL